MHLCLIHGQQFCSRICPRLQSHKRKFLHAWQFYVFLGLSWFRARIRTWLPAFLLHRCMSATCVHEFVSGTNISTLFLTRGPSWPPTAYNTPSNTPTPATASKRPRVFFLPVHFCSWHQGRPGFIVTNANIFHHKNSQIVQTVWLNDLLFYRFVVPSQKWTWVSSLKQIRKQLLTGATPAARHVRHCYPRVSLGVVTLHRTQAVPRRTIITTNCIQVICKSRRWNSFVCQRSLFWLNTSFSQESMCESSISLRVGNRV